MTYEGRHKQLGILRGVLDTIGDYLSGPSLALAGIDSDETERSDRQSIYDGLKGLVSFMSGPNGRSTHSHVGSSIINVHDPQTGTNRSVDKSNCPNGTPLIRYVMDMTRVSRNVARTAIKNAGKRKGKKRR